MRINRIQTPKVQGGRVKKKNNWSATANYYNTPQAYPVVDRKRPGAGYRHVLKRADIYNFIDLLPDWAELSVGLNAVVLAPGEPGAEGYHRPGAVHVCAWEEPMAFEINGTDDYRRAHLPIFERIGVPCTPITGNLVQCDFDEKTVRAYQLLHIFLHELGHHHDRMTTRAQRNSGRGEPYAEAYALKHEALIWDSYWKHFR